MRRRVAKQQKEKRIVCRRSKARYTTVLRISGLALLRNDIQMYANTGMFGGGTKLHRIDLLYSGLCCLVVARIPGFTRWKFYK